MLLKSIEYYNFRNLVDNKIEVGPGLNIVYGKNASGKTSLLEAIALLSDGQSFRTRKIGDLLKWSTDSGFVKGMVDQDEFTSLQEIRITGRQRCLFRDGKQIIRLIDYLGGLPYVLFIADHLNIAQAGPESRRAFIDRALLQLYPRYLDLYRTYTKILNHRNQLLRSPTVEEEELATWTATLIRSGSEIMKKRLEYLGLLAAIACERHHAFTQTENLGFSYRFSMGGSSIGPEVMPLEKLEQVFVEGLKRTRDLEKRRGITMVGPHRDDIVILLNSRSLRAYGSRGQQRSSILSLKLAELELFKKIQGVYPILLLDDVTAELDEGRCRDFLQAIHEDIQSFISTTDYGKVMRLIRTSSVFSMEKGVLSSEVL